MTEANGMENTPDDQVDPPMLAETCMRELVGRASFGHIRSVLRPVLRLKFNKSFKTFNWFAFLGTLIFTSCGFPMNLRFTLFG